MKKISLLAFILALTIGIVFAVSFNFGRFSVGQVFCRVQGSGVLKTEKRNVGDFTSIKAGGAINVQVVAQKDFDVEVEADDNLLPLIKTEVSGDTLKIYSEGRISTRSKINVRISMPEIDGLEVSGASNASVSNVNADRLSLDASGASKIEIGGEARDLEIDSSGASKIDAENLKAENVNVDASGASRATVFAGKEVIADASGASSIYYAGDPKDVTSKNSGASSVKRK